MTKQKVLIGKNYRYVDGTIYRVCGVAKNVETSQNLVIYQAQHGQFELFALPFEQFFAPVDHSSFPNAKQNNLFEPINTKHLNAQKCKK